MRRARVPRLARAVLVIGLGDESVPYYVEPTHGRASDGTWLTDYAAGRLRGFIRIFYSGYFLSSPDLTLPVADRPTGPVPDLETWAAFDAKAFELGVAGFVNKIRKDAQPDSGFLATLGRAVTSVGHGVTSGHLDAAAKGLVQTANVLVSGADRFIPGAGGVLGSALVNALTPLVPFMPALTATLTTVAGNVPLVGPGLGPVVNVAGKSVQTFVEGPRMGAGQQLTLPTSAQTEINNALVKTLTDAAQRGAVDLGPLKFSLHRIEQSYQRASGPLYVKLASASIEGLQQLAFAVQLAAAIMTVGGSVAPIALASEAVLQATSSQALTTAAAQLATATSQAAAASAALTAIGSTTAAAKSVVVAGTLVAQRSPDANLAVKQAILSVGAAAASIATAGAVPKEFIDLLKTGAQAGAVVYAAKDRAAKLRDAERTTRALAQAYLNELDANERALLDELARLKAARRAPPSTAAGVLVLATVAGVGTFVLGRALR